MSHSLNLDGKRMNAIQTAANGAVNVDTVFEFHQSEDRVWAEYSGGQIAHGYLVGVISDDRLEFRYCQMQLNSVLDGGRSMCELRLAENALIQIVEYFEWESRSGGGVNIFQEIKRIHG